jgi:tRNA (guanine-N7-)-methyltransferase
VIPDEAVEEPGFTWSSRFGRTAPLVVEIGSGVGEATAALAALRPEVDVLAFEVWRPGVASTLERLAEAGVTNVRLCTVDAAWCLEHLVDQGALHELWTFFPDPWQKKRHQKRRLVSQRFVDVAAGRLGPGAWWRLATDWADYAEQMRQLLDAEPRLRGGVVPRWSERPVTRFERKGVAAGRATVDLAYQRVD